MADGPGARPDPAAGQTRVIGEAESDDAIGTQAAHWFAVMRGPDADARRAAFEQWRDSDPRRARAYDEVADLFAVAGGAKRTAFDADRSDRPDPARVPAARRRPSRIVPFGIAAALIAAVGIGRLYVSQPLLGEATLSPSVETAKEAPARVERFADGSLALLGAASLVTANLSAAVREIVLEKGQARFIVARDAARDFVVVGRRRTITAREAMFDVWVSDEGTTVSVIAGTVDVVSPDPGQVRTLTAGESVTLGEAGTAAARAAPPAGWPPARIAVQDIALADVVRIANAAGNPPIVLATSDLAPKRLTGTFDVRDTTSLARKLAAALDLDVDATPSDIRLSPRRRK